MSTAIVRRGQMQAKRRNQGRANRQPHKWGLSEMQKISKVLVAGLMIGFSAQASADSLVDSALAGNTYARESIRTIHFNFESTTYLAEGKQETLRGEYWREGKKWKVEQDDRTVIGHKERYVCDGKTVRVLANSHIGGKMTQTGCILPADRKSLVTDPWIMALMVVEFEPGQVLPVKEAVERGMKVSDTKKVGENVVILFGISKGQIEVTLSPANNFLATVWSGWGTSSSRDNRGELRVTKMAEPTPGVFFPEEVDYTLYQSGKGRLYRRTRFAAIQINRELSANTFSLSFPRGILLSNRIREQVYRSDEQGEPIDKLVSTLLPPPSPQPEQDSQEPIRETKEESKSLSRWLLPAGVIFLVIAVVLVLYRRVRRIGDV